MNNLTNQELVQELQKRIKAGTIEAKVVADEVQKNSTSLFSLLGGKELLILIGLTTATALLFCSMLKVTSNQVTSYDINFDEPPINIDVSNTQ